MYRILNTYYEEYKSYRSLPEPYSRVISKILYTLFREFPKLAFDRYLFDAQTFAKQPASNAFFFDKRMVKLFRHLYRI